MKQRVKQTIFKFIYIGINILLVALYFYQTIEFLFLEMYIMSLLHGIAAIIWFLNLFMVINLFKR